MGIINREMCVAYATYRTAGTAGPVRGGLMGHNCREQCEDTGPLPHFCYTIYHRRVTVQLKSRDGKVQPGRKKPSLRDAKARQYG